MLGALCVEVVVASLNSIRVLERRLRAYRSRVPLCFACYHHLIFWCDVAALRRELNERSHEVEEHDARYETEIKQLHVQMESLETQLKESKAAEADQSDTWREKATEMVEKLTADAREETDFWKNESGETIKKASLSLPDPQPNTNTHL